jgi:hypoxanthine phosphoribosyltransferase
MGKSCAGHRSSHAGYELDMRIPRSRIHRRVAALAKQIQRIYDGQPLVVVGVMSGALFFLSDLLRRLKQPLQLELVTLRSYRGKSTRPGRIQWIHRLQADVTGRHVLLVDDVLDSGQTLSIVQRAIRRKKPLSCRTCVLLRKERAVKPKVEADWVGFHIEDVFVVGYGLDFDGLYRNIPDIAIMQPLG